MILRNKAWCAAALAGLGVTAFAASLLATADVRFAAGGTPDDRSEARDTAEDAPEDLPRSPSRPSGFDVRTLDERRRPVRGAEVYVLHLVGDGQPRSVPEVITAGPFFADVDGVARVTGLPEDDGGHRFDQFVYARLPGERVGARRRTYWSFDKGSPPPDDPFELLLVDSVELRGRVTVPRGFEAEDVTVRMLSFHVDRGTNDRTFPYLEVAPDVWPELFETRPDGEGRFVIRDTPAAGVRYLAVNASGLGETQWMDPEGSKSSPRFRMRPEGVLEGIVRHHEDPGGADATVEGLNVIATPHGGGYILRRRPAVVGPDGRFRIGGLPAGLFMLQVEGPPEGWTVAPRLHVRVTAGRATGGADLNLERGTLLRGRVVDEETGEPVAGVLVAAAFPGDTPHAVEVDRVRTGGEGIFRLRVPAGPSRVAIRGRPAGYRPARDPEWREVLIDTRDGNKQGTILLKLRRAEAPRRPVKTSQSQP